MTDLPDASKTPALRSGALAESIATAVLHTLSSHVAVIGPMGRILWVNRAWRTYAEANPVGGNVCEGADYLAVCDAAPAGEEGHAARAIAAAIRDAVAGQDVHFEAEYPCHSDSEQRWFRATVHRLQGEAAGVDYAVVAHHDITQRKLAELDALAGQRHLDALLDAAHTVLRGTSSDPAEFLLERARQTLGVATACFLQRLPGGPGAADTVDFNVVCRVNDRCEPGDGPPHCLQQAVREASQLDRPVVDNDAAPPTPCPSGSMRGILAVPVDIDDQPYGVLAVGGKPGGFTADDERLAAGFGEMLAVTIYRERAAAALRESELRFRTLFEHLPIGAVIYRPVDDEGSDYVCAVVNAKTLENAGARAGEVVGCRLNDPAWRDLQYMIPLIRQSQQQGEPVPISDRYFDNNQGGMWYDALFFPLPAGDIVGLFFNVTGRHRHEETIRRYQQQLKDLSAANAQAEERERRVLAADLHDQIGQPLSVAQIKLEELLRSMGHEGAAAVVEGCVKLVRGAVADIRGVVYDLSPPILYDLGLMPALEWLGEHCGERYGLRVRLHPAPCRLTELPETLRAVVYRAVRELLVNAAKHAQPTGVDVKVHVADDELALTVLDDGVGFDPEAAHDGFGLFNIREQLGSLGGRLEIQSAPGEGTRATLFAPIEKKGTP